MKLSVVPVLDDKNLTRGVVMVNDLIGKIAEMSSLKEPGGIIVLSLLQNNYCCRILHRS
ncbi:MAG: hypothetical protein R2744_06365 [Bacteroidales bacterium]